MTPEGVMVSFCPGNVQRNPGNQNAQEPEATAKPFVVVL
jgi:hypothetical protein